MSARAAWRADSRGTRAEPRRRWQHATSASASPCAPFTPACPTRLRRGRRLDGKHVVFGRVLEGVDIVKAIEAKGSASGKTSAEVVIVDCGELPVDATA